MPAIARWAYRSRRELRGGAPGGILHIGGERLRREIGPFGSAMLVLNGVVGAGIFALPGTLLADFGAFSAWLIPLFGVFIFLIAIPLGELAGHFDRTGGPVAYTREAFGPFVSFQTGWAYYLTRVTALAANTLVFVTYAAALRPELGEGAPRAAMIVLLIGAITAINVVGVKRAVTALDALSVFKVAPLLFMTLLGAALYGFKDGGPIVLPEFSDIERASLLVLYAFVGFEVSLFPAGETKDPQRTIPRALIVALGATIAFYFLIQFAYAATMAGETAGAAPLVTFGEKLLGPVGAFLMLAAALVSVGGNLLSCLIVAPRVTYALALEGALPSWFGRVSERFATPANSIVFLGALGCLLALTGSFAALAVVSTLARFLVYAASLAALPAIRRKRALPARTGAARILSPLVLGGGLLFCLWAISQSTAKTWAVFGVLVLVGGALYAVARFAKARLPA